jgi:hypothetical protein
VDFPQLMARLGRNGQVIVGGGVLAFILSFLPWYTASSKFTGSDLGIPGVTIPGSSYSSSVGAWDAGIGAWFPVLLLVALAVLVVLVALEVVSLAPTAVAFVTLAGGALAAVIILLRWLTFPSSSTSGLGYSFSYGAGWALYVGLVVAIAVAVFGYLDFTAKGGSLSNIPGAFGPSSDTPNPLPEPPSTPQI